MKKLIALALVMAAIGTSALAQSADATTDTATSSTCCALRFNSEEWGFGGGKIASVRILLDWVRSDGTIERREEVLITDGVEGNPADDYLTGSGANGEPLGYIRATLQGPQNEAGTFERRWKRRRLSWLRENARLTNNAITLQ